MKSGNKKKEEMIPDILSSAKDRGDFYVFFVNSPITVIITKLCIEEYKLDPKKILIVSIRDTKTNILDYETINPKRTFIDRIILRFFKIDLFGKKISNQIKKLIDKNYLIFCSWYYPEVQASIKSNNCIAHLYIEEGQLSYSDIKPISIEEMERENKTKVYREPYLRKNFFLNTAKAYLGIFPNVFPQISKDLRFTLNNHSDILKIYKPKLIGIKNIGLTCAERRIKDNDWRIIIDKLIADMTEGGVIKLHPSFNSSKTKFEIIKNYTELKSENRVRLCSLETIIEIEMMQEPKKLIGPLTSLRYYAESMGSSFQEIKLY